MAAIAEPPPPVGVFFVGAGAIAAAAGPAIAPRAPVCSANDILILEVMSKNIVIPANEINTPAGWTLLSPLVTVDHATNNQHDMRCGIFWKRAVLADSNAIVNVTRAGADSAGLYGVISAWSGAKTAGSPWSATAPAVFSRNTDADTFEFPAYTAAEAYSRLLYFGFMPNDQTSGANALFMNGGRAFQRNVYVDSTVSSDATIEIYSANNIGEVFPAVSVNAFITTDTPTYCVAAALVSALPLGPIVRVRKTVEGAGGNYPTLQAAVTGELALRSALQDRNETLEIICYASANANEIKPYGVAGAVVDGFITDLTRRVRIIPAPGQHHQGKYDPAKYLLDVTDARGIDVRDNFVRVEGLQVMGRTTAALLTGVADFYVGPTMDPGAAQHVFINCLAKGRGAQVGTPASKNQYGFESSALDRVNAVGIYINCIAEDITDYSDPLDPVNAYGFSNSALPSGPAYAYYNCESRNCYRGFRERDYIRAKNCRTMDCEDGWNITTLNNPASRANTSSKGDGTNPDLAGGDAVNSRDGVCGLMRDPLTGDWSVSDGDVDWKGRGVPLHADAIFAFDFDVTSLLAYDGTDALVWTPNRPTDGSPWTIGAFEARGAFSQDVSWAWAGAVQPTTARVRARLTVPLELGLVSLVVATNVDLANAEVFGPVPAPAALNNVATFDLTGLDPHTDYYYAVRIGATTYTNKQGRFRTFPAGAASFTIALASCWLTGSGGDDVFDAIAAQDPALFLHLGDLHYLDIGAADQARYRAGYDMVLHSAAMQRVYRRMAVDYVWSDHDHGAGNSDGTSPSRATAEAAYRENVPHYPLPEVEVAHDPIYHAFTIGRVRVIMCDSRSNKTPRGVLDNAAKTMLGAQQKVWLKQELLIARDAGQVVVLAFDVPWIGLAKVNDDSWLGYATERRELSDFFVDNNIVNCLRIAGDMHSTALDDGRNDVWATGPRQPHLAQVQAGPLNQTNSVKGDPLMFSAGVPFEHRSAFATLRITDEGGTTITVDIAGRNRFGVTQVSMQKRYTVGHVADRWTLVRSAAERITPPARAARAPADWTVVRRPPSLTEA